MSEHNSLIASYANHKLARDTVRKLQRAGFDRSNLFVVARDGGNDLEGAAVVSALSDLGDDQFGCIPRENIPDYEDELKVDRLLIVAHGTPDEIEQARSVIDTTHPEGWDGNVGCAIFYGCMD